MKFWAEENEDNDTLVEDDKDEDDAEDEEPEEVFLVTELFYQIVKGWPKDGEIVIWLGHNRAGTMKLTYGTEYITTSYRTKEEAEKVFFTDFPAPVSVSARPFCVQPIQNRYNRLYEIQQREFYYRQIAALYE